MIEIAEKKLAEFFPEGKKQYTDEDFQKIVIFMDLSELKQWSSIPRIYTVLRTIGGLQLMDDFLKNGITDILFPSTPKNLPSWFPPSIKARFVDTQSIVLTPTLDLEKGENGHHVTFAEGGPIWLESLRELGRGSYGTVDKVRSLVTLKLYARKRMLKGNNFDTTKKVMKDFKNELAVLKTIKHKHCVKIIGSYTDPQYLGLIMDPVADCDLTTFLMRFRNHPDNRSILRSFFGCLTSALQYLHEKRIIHGDIKPSNVLVKGNSVYLADFSIALDWSEMTRGTTTGDTVKSVDYCAPEVANSWPTEASSDIWSLGCIFVEMVTVLKRKTVKDMRAHFVASSRNHRFYYNAEQYSLWLKILKGLNSPRDNLPISCASDMLRQDPVSRATADSLLEKIRRCYRYDPSRRLSENFCGECCIRYEDPQPNVGNYQEAGLWTDSDDENATDGNIMTTLTNPTRMSVTANQRTDAESPMTYGNILFSRSRDPAVSDREAGLNPGTAVLYYHEMETSDANSTRMPVAENQRTDAESPELITSTSQLSISRDHIVSDRRAVLNPRTAVLYHEMETSDVEPVGAAAARKFWELSDNFNEQVLMNWRPPNSRKVRVAILDSGFLTKGFRDVGCSTNDPFLLAAAKRQIKKGKSWVGGDPNDWSDAYGHGTHVARLLMQVATGAELYIAKVTQGEDIAFDDLHIIAEAINWAVTEWDVDIISMSLGLDRLDAGIEKALDAAINPANGSSRKIVFAAASNGGANVHRVYPARRNGVICISASDGYGNTGGFNPTPVGSSNDNDSFTTLGVDVESKWDNKDVYKSSTSFSTPIAAGIASNILEFAMQEKVYTNDHQKQFLFSYQGITKVFRQMSVERDGYYYITPWLRHEQELRRQSTDGELGSIHDAVDKEYIKKLILGVLRY